jgi:hypothetical protein
VVVMRMVRPRGLAARGTPAALAAAVALLAALTAACGATTAVRHVDQVPASAGAQARQVPLPHDPCAFWPGVGAPAKKPRWHREPLPAGFDPVMLITCDEQERTTAANGEWTYRIEKQATQGLDKVVAALRSTPPPPPTGEISCAAVFRGDPWLLLVDRSGRVVLPVVPQDRACDQPIDIGLEGLHYSIVLAKRVMQQATAAELATDCTDRWKNEPRMFAGESKAATSRVTVRSRPVGVCTYSSRSSKDPEVGSFRGGLRLAGADARRIGALLTGDAPNVGVGPCAPADDYAVVHTADSSWVYVELSGCKRLFVDEAQTWTAPVPDLVRAIKALHLQR